MSFHSVSFAEPTKGNHFIVLKTTSTDPSSGNPVDSYPYYGKVSDVQFVDGFEGESLVQLTILKPNGDKTTLKISVDDTGNEHSDGAKKQELKKMLLSDETDTLILPIWKQPTVSDTMDMDLIVIKSANQHYADLSQITNRLAQLNQNHYACLTGTSETDLHFNFSNMYQDLVDSYKQRKVKSQDRKATTANQLIDSGDY